MSNEQWLHEVNLQALVNFSKEHTVYLHNYTFGDFGYLTLHYQAILTSYTISCINELKIHIQSEGKQNCGSLTEIEVNKGN